MNEFRKTAARRCASVLALSFLLLTLSGCGGRAAQAPKPAPEEAELPAAEPVSGKEAEPTEVTPTEEEEQMLSMKIGDTAVSVIWEENASVEALRELCRKAPLSISMSMYGGFEQVGAIGSRLPRSDVQTTTAAGDIVLYSGNQLVVFYGSNSWAYTRLGHISDKSAEALTALLGSGDVTITLSIAADP